jgi:predicted Zn-dependent protease
VGAANDLAWLLATSAAEEVLDPKEAVRLAELAISRAGRDPNRLDTLAASYAADGRFEEAARAAAEAVERASAQDRKALAEQIAERRERYRSHHPYREPPRAPPAVKHTP